LILMSSIGLKLSFLKIMKLAHREVADSLEIFTAGVNGHLKATRQIFLFGGEYSDEFNHPLEYLNGHQ
jgi:hypothetical protein